MTGDRMTFELNYQFADETLVSNSELRFLSQQGIEERLNAAGLCADTVLGNWEGRPFDEKSSREMIVVARKLA